MSAEGGRLAGERGIEHSLPGSGVREAPSFSLSSGPRSAKKSKTNEITGGGGNDSCEII